MFVIKVMLMIKVILRYCSMQYDLRAISKSCFVSASSFWQLASDCFTTKFLCFNSDTFS